MSIKKSQRTGPHAATKTILFTLLSMVVIVLSTASTQAASRKAGKVLFVRGITTAQQPGAGARIVGRGQPLYERDLLSTGTKSYAVIRLADGSRMTLRPATRFRIDKLHVERSTGNALLSLFKGGIRVITGYISKRTANAFRLVTPIATIGIRGTEFDARLCASECTNEIKGMQRVAATRTSPVVARVVWLHGGKLLARSWSGKVHPRFKGGPIYQGDTLITGAATAVIAFRDNTRVSLRPGTRFQVEHYGYAPKAKEPGNAFFRLFKGGLRAVTGYIAKKRKRFFRLVTPVATIGIRGTGFDVFCDGDCAAGKNPVDLGAENPPPATTMSALSAGAKCRAGQDFQAYVWRGAITVQNQSGVYALGTDQAACIPANTTIPRQLSKIPEFMLKNPIVRPDTVPVDIQQLFSAQAPEGAKPGLYVSVEEGHVLIGSLDVGGGESAYTDPETQISARLIGRPPIIQIDPYPRPRTFDPTHAPVIGLGPPGGSGPPGAAPNMCTL